MHTLIPFWVLRGMRLPVLAGISRAGLTRIFTRLQNKLPRELIPEVEAIFYDDLIGNIATLDPEKPDSFRFAFTNTWFHQRVNSISMMIDGKQIPPNHITVNNDFLQVRGDKIRRLRFVPGHPFTLTIGDFTLRDGLHFVGIELECELANLIMPLLPVMIQGNQARIAFGNQEPLPWPESITETKKQTIHFVPHIHYDYEWLQTADRFMKTAVSNLQEAVKILDEHPQATFAVDQAPQLLALESADPAAFEKLLGFIKQGRVEPLLGGYVEPDTNLPHGESLVRQFIRWQQFAEEKFGAISKTGWLIDSFGISPQMPQILRKCGAESFVFSRSMPEESNTPSDFIWEGIDGTRIHTHYMSRFYFAGYPVASEATRAQRKLERTVQRLSAASNQKHLLCPSGSDHARPQTAPVAAIADWNEHHPNHEMRFSLPSQYFDMLREDRMPYFRGDLGPEFPGVYAARIDLKQQSRRVENALPTAEALGVITHTSTSLDEAWDKLLLSHFHDSLPGCHTDAVHDDVRRRLLRAEETAEQSIATSLSALSAEVSKKFGGSAVIIYNPSGFRRREVVEIDLPATDGIFPNITDGVRFIPYQMLEVERYLDDTAKGGRCCFSADVPALGYRVYYLTTDDGFEKPEQMLAVDADEEYLENGVIHFRFNPDKGALKFVVDPETSRLWQPKGAGSLQLRRDRGNLYQTWQTGLRKKQKVNQFRVIETGPIRGVLEASGTVGRSTFTTRYELDYGSRALKVRSHVDFRDPDYALSTPVPHEPYPYLRVLSEVPYGAIRRSYGHYCAQNYVYVEYDNGKSVTLVNKGTPGYMNDSKELRLDLHRSVDKIHFWDAGHGAFGLGAHDFEYELHFEDDVIGGSTMPWRAGAAANQPLQVIGPLTGSGESKAPLSRSYVKIERDNVMLGALRTVPGENNVVELRCAEAAGLYTKCNIRLGFPVENAEITDMLGRSAAPVRVVAGRIRVGFHPFEIKTIRLTLANGETEGA